MQKKYILLLMISLSFLTVSAQKKKLYQTDEEITKAAINFLDQDIKSGELNEWANQSNVFGSYTMDITIYGKKAQVVTVTAIERSENSSIENQNNLKNYIKQIRMPFKLPKDKRQKFQYQFNFSK